METESKLTVFFELTVWVYSINTNKPYRQVRTARTFDELYRLCRSGIRWQIDRVEPAARRVMLAQSDRFPSVKVAEHMRDGGKTAIIDGCSVEAAGDRVYVYFKPINRYFDSHIKIYQQNSISLVGNVTLENFDGFLKAAEVARALLKP